MKRYLSWLIFILYILISGVTIARHELWGDEVHSWNISKGSTTYAELIANRRFEGHPPGWYTILWTISRFSHNIKWMQAVQWILACTVAFIIIFHSPFPFLTRHLIPFGYFFIFEYAVFSRNYAIGVLLICCICLVLRKEFRYRNLLYYLLLFLASNTHLLVLLLAASIHVWWLLSRLGKPKTRLLGEALLGFAIFLPAARFIFPPSDSALSVSVWISHWSFHKIAAAVDLPLRSFLPIPAWWNYHFWNTHFLIEARQDWPVFKIINLLVASGLIAFGFYILRANLKSMALFGVNCILSLVLTIVAVQLTVTRYTGFIFVGWLIAYWLYCYESAPPERERRWVDVLLCIHILAGAFAVIRDITLPFSNLFRVNTFIAEVPQGQKLVTDYWTMNAVVAYTDKPAYCVDMDKTISFVLWNPDVAMIEHNHYRYTSGLQRYMAKEKLDSVYMISEASPQILQRTDTRLYEKFRLDIIDKKEGALEKGSNLYLYRISPL